MLHSKQSLSENFLVIFLLSLFVFSCDQNSPAKPSSSVVVEEQTLAEKKIVFLGDSLTAGYRLDYSEAYPALIAQYLKEQGLSQYEVINAGVSGDTTEGVLNRLDWAVVDHTKIVFLAIGANDGLRAFPIEKIRENLQQIIESLQQQGIEVILAGMKLPPNYGLEYTGNFAYLYEELAAQYELTFFPFLLKDVAGRSHLNLADGIHPNAKGHRIIADNLIAFFQEEGIFRE